MRKSLSVLASGAVLLTMASPVFARSNAGVKANVNAQVQMRNAADGTSLSANGNVVRRVKKQVAKQIARKVVRKVLKTNNGLHLGIRLRSRDINGQKPAASKIVEACAQYRGSLSMLTACLNGLKVSSSSTSASTSSSSSMSTSSESTSTSTSSSLSSTSSAQ